MQLNLDHSDNLFFEIVQDSIVYSLNFDKSSFYRYLDDLVGDKQGLCKDS